MLQSAFQYKKPAPSAKLNLVALMDIFTILVFFLLLNSGEAEKLESAKFVTLPDSHAANPPHNDLVVMIDKEAIWFGDTMLVALEEVPAESGEEIPALSEALADYLERKGELNAYERENGLSLTIMGDHEVPYSLLKTVMTTCRLANFRELSLAVNRVAPPTPADTQADAPALAEFTQTRN
jgi:biopolymer transport protein ExbD